MWWRTKEISWTDRVKNGELLPNQGLKECSTYKKEREANWIGHMLRKKHII